jgi:hypothetical protein
VAQLDTEMSRPSQQLTDVTIQTGHRGRATPATSGFVTWGAGIYLVTVTGIAAICLHRTGGRWVYALDDPGIHLSVATNLAEHGTWGVVPGHFQSASSSPLWTVLLAAWIKILPGAANVAPFILNVLAALAVIAIVGANQRVLRPGLDRPLDILAVAALVTVVLFLPSLTMVGMEHTLHVALVLAGVILLYRSSVGDGGRWPRWLPYVLLAVATLVRFETAFVAAGLAVALLLPPATGPVAGPVADDAGGLRRRLRPAALVGLASALPLAAFGLFNHLMGQGLLPSSVLAKTRSPGSGGQNSYVYDVFARLTEDPVLVVLTGATLVIVVLAWSQLRHARFLAVVLLTSVGLHVVFARVGWFDRYQAYLITIGVYLVLEMLAEGLSRPDLGMHRTRVTTGIVAVLLLFSGTKAALTIRTPDAIDDTYAQRYQAARFLERYYDGRPVATGELGYISLLHDGPLTDLFGLGDYEVLTARRDHGGEPGAGYWEDLTQRREFPVAAVYPATLSLDTPDSWILVGAWTMDRKPITAFERTFQFWATTTDEVAPLEDHLREFESELPDGIELEINEGAGLQAMHRDQLAREEAPDG